MKNFALVLFLFGSFGFAKKTNAFQFPRICVSSLLLDVREHQTLKSELASVFAPPILHNFEIKEGPRGLAECLSAQKAYDLVFVIAHAEASSGKIFYPVQGQARELRVEDFNRLVMNSSTSKIFILNCYMDEVKKRYFSLATQTKINWMQVTDEDNAALYALRDYLQLPPRLEEQLLLINDWD